MQCGVWVANGRYGLHLKIPGAKFGDVTFFSVFFGPFIPWRRQLYRAAKRLQRTKSGDPIQRFLSVQYSRGAMAWGDRR
jgi:hypothetical protein